MRERIGLDPDHIRRLDHIRVGSLLTVDKGDVGKKRANRLASGVMAAEGNDSFSRGIRKSQFCRFIRFRPPISTALACVKTSSRTMYANSEDFQVLAITTMVSSFVVEWNDPNMKLHHEWKVVPLRPLSMRSRQSNGKARGQLLKSKLNISERAAPVNFGSIKSAARFTLLQDISGSSTRDTLNSCAVAPSGSSFAMTTSR